MKYKNKDGIELNYSGNDIQSELTKEVVEEAIKILGMYDRSCKISMGMAMMNTKKFLKTNFDIGVPAIRLFDQEVKKYCYMWKDGGQFSTDKYNNKEAIKD